MSVCIKDQEASCSDSSSAKPAASLWVTTDELPVESKEHFIDETEYFGHFLYGDAPLEFKAFVDKK